MQHKSPMLPAESAAIPPASAYRHRFEELQADWDSQAQRLRAVRLVRRQRAPMEIVVVKSHDYADTPAAQALLHILTGAALTLATLITWATLASLAVQP